MTRAAVQTYELFDEACELLAAFGKEITPRQILSNGAEAWLFVFGAKLMIDKSLVMLNYGVTDEVTEVHEILTNLVKDLREELDHVRR